MMTPQPPAPLTPAQEKRVLITTAIISGMGFADMIAVNTALPVIQSELSMDATSALWVAEIYLLFVASLMMMGGALGDRFGRRRVLRYGVIAFAASSLFCAASSSSEMLVFGRAIQGLSAALTMPSSLALLNACFPPERRGQAIGTWTAISSMMIPLGPLAGGVAVDLLSWHWIFLINLPLCAIALFILQGVPGSPYGQTRAKRLDIAGVIGMTAGLGTLVFGLLEGARRGFTDDMVLGSLVAAAVILPSTVFIEAKSREPMLPVGLFRQRIFMLANLQTFFFFASFQGAMFLLPFFHIQVFGFTALQAGAAGLPISIAMILLSRLVGRFMDRFGAGPLLATAPFVAAAGLLLLAQVPADGSYFYNVFPAIILVALGLALFIAPITTVALNSAGEQRSGLASAVNNTMARVAGLVSVALFGVLLTSGFSSHLTAHLNRLALDADQRFDITRQIHRLGAIMPPDTLTIPETEAFHQLVREAFTQGFENAVTAAFVFMLLAGFVGFLGLRKIRSTNTKLR